MSSPSKRLDLAESGKAARQAFSLSTSAHTVYRFKQWQEAWGHLSDQLEARPRLVWLLGDPGTGKSTMLECLANALAGRGASFTRLRGAQVDGYGFLQLASISLGLDESLTEPEALTERLQAHLRAVSARRDHWLLVDDGDLLSASAFESLLRLADITSVPTRTVKAPDHTDGVKERNVKAPGGVRIVLAGPHRLPISFGEQLGEFEIGAATAQVTLGVLERPETYAYLLHCLARSRKAEQAKFTPKAATAVHHYSRGVPRVANQIGARLVFNALLEGSDNIDLGDVTDVVDGLRAEGLIDVVEPFANHQGSTSALSTRSLDRTEGVGETKATGEEGIEPTAPSQEALEEDDGRGVARWTESGAHQSSKPVAPAVPAERRRARPGRLVVPAFALVVLVLASAVALRLWNEEVVVDDSARAPHLQSDERLSASDVEGSPPLEEAVGSADGPTVASSLESEEVAPQPLEKVLTSESSAGSGALPEQEAPKIENSVAASVDSTSVTPPPVGDDAAAELSGPPGEENEIRVVEDDFDQTGLDMRRVAAAPKAAPEKSRDAELEPPREEPHRYAAPEPPIESLQQRPPPTEKADVASVVQSASSAALEEGSRGNEETGASASRNAQAASETFEAEHTPSPIAGSQSFGEPETERAFETSEQLAASTENPPKSSHSPAASSARDELLAPEALEPVLPNSGNQGTDEGSDVDDSPARGAAITMLREPSAAAYSSDTLERWANSVRVRELLEAAAADLENNRLTTPLGENAYERFQTVLELDPGNAQALEGLETIVRSYAALVERARVAGELERALSYLDRADAVSPGSPEIQALRERVRDDMAGVAQVVGSGTPPATVSEESPTTIQEFVMLPTRTSPDCAWPFDRHLADAVREFIRNAGLLEVSFSAPAADTGVGEFPQDSFWLGSSPHEVPDDNQVYLYGERVGARWVLLSRIDCPSSAVVYEPWRGFQIHLFDVESGIAYLQSGTLGELTSTTEKVLMANISGDGG